VGGESVAVQHHQTPAAAVHDDRAQGGIAPEDRLDSSHGVVSGTTVAGTASAANGELSGRGRKSGTMLLLIGARSVTLRPEQMNVR
jgi:hypothetical protein